MLVRDALAFVFAMDKNRSLCPNGLCKQNVAKLDIAKLTKVSILVSCESPCLLRNLVGCSQKFGVGDF